MKIDSNNLILDYLYKKKDFLTFLLKKKKSRNQDQFFQIKTKSRKSRKLRLVNSLICHEILKTSMPAHFWPYCTKNPKTILSNNFAQFPAFIQL